MKFHAWDEYQEYVGIVDMGYIKDEDSGIKNYVADIITPMANVSRKHISEDMFSYFSDFEVGYGCCYEESELAFNFHTGNVKIKYFIRIE